MKVDNSINHNYLILNISNGFNPSSQGFGEFLQLMGKELEKMGKEFDKWEIEGNESVLKKFLENHKDSYKNWNEMGSY